MYHIYHNVPYCVRCGSKRTAFAVPPDNNMEKNMFRHLKKGEYIFAGFDDGRYNCACLECGMFWKGNVKTQILNEHDWRRAKKDRGIGAKGDLAMAGLASTEKKRPVHANKRIVYFVRTLLGI